MPESNPKKHPVTGCRVDTLVGVVWLCSPEILQPMVDTAWSIVTSGELKNVQVRSTEMEEERREKPYTLHDGIARLSIAGPLTKHPTSMTSLFGGTSYINTREVLREIRDKHSKGLVKGLFIEMDSNGGTVEGCPELADAIRKTAALMPVACHAEDKANSGGLWLATQAPRFTCGPAALVGSQGVALKLVDSSKRDKELGEKPVIITTGKWKALGASDIEITKEDKEELQRHVDLINKPFKQQVRSARKLTDEQAEEIATARVFVGEDAQRVGLVDEICSTDVAFEHFAKSITGTANRGPVSGLFKPAAIRSTGMPLTEQQLADARKLPGAETITAENADAVLLQVASKVPGLTAEIAELKKQVPVVEPEEVLQGMAEVAHSKIDVLLGQGKMTTAQATQLKNLVMGDDKKPNVAVLSKGSDGKRVYERILVSYEENAPNGLVKQNSGNQPTPRDVPGDDKKSTTEKVDERAGSVAQKFADSRFGGGNKK